VDAPVKSPFIAGMLGGVLVEVITGALAVVLVRRLGPKFMRRRMQRMMRAGPSPEMRAWMDKWRAGRPAEEPAP
jgi:hypothetical protein